METKKIDALEAVIADLEISESELTNWFNNRGRDKTGLIPTELPLVYRRKNEFEVLNGLDLRCKDELWGIQLTSGVMVALKCGAGNNVSSAAWDEVKRFAQKMRFNGKPGFLPSKDVLKEHWGTEEETKFAATVEVLKGNDIEADGYEGSIWCSEFYGPRSVYYFTLDYGGDDWIHKGTIGSDVRVALAFN